MNSQTPFDTVPDSNPLVFLQKMFSADFMPHGHCYFWNPTVLWLNVGIEPDGAK